VSSQLIDPSDFLPTLAELAGKKVPPNWQHDGVSFAPAIHKHPGAPPRDWAFFWYDPRPGWDKMAFSRAIFALDHKYKLFSDGRLFAIDGVDYKEELLDPAKLSPEAKAAKAKLAKVIVKMMQPPVSKGAQIVVDAYGNPISKK
jgi:arylsulfatase A-like enzyme